MHGVTNAIGVPQIAAGKEMHDLVARLFPLCRSITGEGVRETLRILKEHIPLQVHEVPSGTQAFDWIVPKEWRIRAAYLLDPASNKVVDFADNNLHVVNYSTPVHARLSLEDLQAHLYSLPDQPEAIPYVTSYYHDRWGFCVSHRQRESMTPGIYTAVIDSEHFDGSLTYGELLLPGEREQEIFLSTNICHPSMANNELSGPVVTTWIAKWLADRRRKYTYRLIFVPETIGSIVYLSRNLAEMKRNIIAGFTVGCVGDDRTFSFLPTPHGRTLTDKIARAVLELRWPRFQSYSYLDRGGDERQYCSPGVDLPVASIMRSKYNTFPEYHTSLDNLDVVTPAGLQGSYDLYRECIELLEANDRYMATVLCEPQLDRRGLYPTLSIKIGDFTAENIVNIMAYLDGENDLVDVSKLTGIPVDEVVATIRLLARNELIRPL